MGGIIRGGGIIRAAVAVSVLDDGEAPLDDADELEERGVFLHRHQFRHVHPSGPDHAVQVVPYQVYNHEVFCALFGRGE